MIWFCSVRVLRHCVSMRDGRPLCSGPNRVSDHLFFLFGSGSSLKSECGTGSRRPSNMDPIRILILTFPSPGPQFLTDNWNFFGKLVWLLFKKNLDPPLPFSEYGSGYGIWIRIRNTDLDPKHWSRTRLFLIWKCFFRDRKFYQSSSYSP